MPPLCPQCGVVAPPRSRRCQLCELPLGANTLTAPEAPAGRVWAAVWCWFRCPGCGVDVPVDDFAAGVVPCPACGTAHALRGLGGALEHAHAVADLAGPDPEGRFPDARVSVAASNPFKSVGLLHALSEDRRDAWATPDDHGGPRVSVRVAPGHPLCDACRGPLQVTVDGEGLTARCAGCCVGFRSRVAPAVRTALGRVAGIISAAHREDRAVAAIAHDEATGEVRFRCPDCTSALGDPHGRRALTCEMCRLVCVVPAAHWRVKPGEAIPLQGAWVLFDGPSKLRDDLARDARRRAEHTVRALVPGKTGSTPPGRGAGRDLAVDGRFGAGQSRWAQAAGLVATSLMVALIVLGMLR